MCNIVRFPARQYEVSVYIIVFCLICVFEIRTKKKNKQTKYKTPNKTIRLSFFFSFFFAYILLFSLKFFFFGFALFVGGGEELT